MSEKWMRGRLRGSGHLVSGLAVGRNSPAQGMTGASDETFKPSLPFSTSGRFALRVYKRVPNARTPPLCCP